MASPTNVLSYCHEQLITFAPLFTAYSIALVIVISEDIMPPKLFTAKLIGRMVVP